MATRMAGVRQRLAEPTPLRSIHSCTCAKQTGARQLRRGPRTHVDPSVVVLRGGAGASSEAGRADILLPPPPPLFAHPCTPSVIAIPSGASQREVSTHKDDGPAPARLGLNLGGLLMRVPPPLRGAAERGLAVQMCPMAHVRVTERPCACMACLKACAWAVAGGLWPGG
jgi:hypothetical protein